MDAWFFFLQGIALGVAAAATPGAFQAYLITQSILNGFRRGRVIAFAPVISDPPVVMVVLLFLNQLPQSLTRAISFVGGVYVLYLAYGTFNQWRSPSKTPGDESQSNRGSILRAAILNILSPGLYLYWTLVNGPLLISAIQQSAVHGIAFLLGFYGFFVGGMLVIAALFAQTRRLGEKFVRNILLVSTMILAAFGIFLILRSLFN